MNKIKSFSFKDVESFFLSFPRNFFASLWLVSLQRGVTDEEGNPSCKPLCIDDEAEEGKKSVTQEGKFLFLASMMRFRVFVVVVVVVVACAKMISHGRQREQTNQLTGIRLTKKVLKTAFRLSPCV